MSTPNKKTLSPSQQADLLVILEARFEGSSHRHPGVHWADVQKRLKASPTALWSLNEMERTGGEPDVISGPTAAGSYIFCDCSAETPRGRRSLCYDDEALESRKQNKPEGSAMGTAAAMGIALLSEEAYQELQKLEAFDLKTSSWVKTPDDVRAHGGALFCDRRYGRVFVYHNGAESYYAARGFRGTLTV